MKKLPTRIFDFLTFQLENAPLNNALTTKYNGEWENGLADGKGVMTFSNGGIYDGQWKNDKYEGNGKLYSIRGHLIYEGSFKNGQQDENIDPIYL